VPALLDAGLRLSTRAGLGHREALTGSEGVESPGGVAGTASPDRGFCGLPKP